MTTGARVLIVDDDAPARRLLQVRLRALGCEVALAADGEEALAQIKKHEPALMLLDLQMPKMGGIEVLRHLRRRRNGISRRGHHRPWFHRKRGGGDERRRL